MERMKTAIVYSMFFVISLACEHRPDQEGNQRHPPHFFNRGIPLHQDPHEFQRRQEQQFENFSERVFRGEDEEETEPERDDENSKGDYQPQSIL